MSEFIYILILIIVIFDFIFERGLDYLNIKHLHPTLPKTLKGIYDQESYKKSQQYIKENHILSLYSSSAIFLAVLLLLIFKGFGELDIWVGNITSNSYLQTLLFYGILGLGMEILSLPFQIYDTFIIEERYGFNKTTTKTFVFDKIKGLFITAIIGGGILLFLQWAFLEGGTLFWIISLVGISIIVLFFTIFYTSLILPLFNKLKPLEEGELKDAIESFAKKSGFSLSRIYIIDGSKRSTKANAFFSGLGPRKTIILYDTLMEQLNPQEIVAVLAHEIGHYKKKHIYKGLLLSLVQITIMILILWWTLSNPEFAMALGGTKSSFPLALLAFALLYSPISFILGLIMNVFSRKHEYEADAFAGSFGLAENLIQALIKLSVKSLSNLDPHPLYVFFHYSHPTLLQRKEQLKN